MVLDEATSSLDSETASRIHDTIRQTFCDCTLIIIAHSMHTVLQCDRVLVIDHGQVFISLLWQTVVSVRTVPLSSLSGQLMEQVPVDCACFAKEKNFSYFCFILYELQFDVRLEIKKPV